MILKEKLSQQASKNVIIVVKTQTETMQIYIIFCNSGSITLKKIMIYVA